MINNSTLVGRITKDPEIRKTGTGKSVVNFTLAVTRRFNKDESDFILINAWDKTADFIGRYIQKGDLLGVEGRIQTSSYEDTDGKRVYKTEIVADNVQALESKAEKENRQSQGGGYQGQGQGYDAGNVSNQGYQEDRLEDDQSGGSPTLDITSDDLPF